MKNKKHQTLLIIDFGSQVTKLIARRLREKQIYCEIHPYQNISEYFLKTLSPKARDMISVAKVCGDILLHGINNVLDTGKHDIGKLEVNAVPTRLHELFQRTWGIYSELLRQKKLTRKGGKT